MTHAQLVALPALLLLVLSIAPRAVAEPEPAKPADLVAHLATFGAGPGPAHEAGTYRLLDAQQTPRQSNAVAFDQVQPHAPSSVTIKFELRVLEGGDGGAFLFLDTRVYGSRGPAPFLPSWVAPNLKRSFAVGIDVHNPKTEEPFGPMGNYQDLPQREVSLHWDGREIVKRVAPAEYRGDFRAGEIRFEHVVGGAEVTVHLGGEAVFDRFFIAEMMPYPSRLAIGAGTRAKATTQFDVRALSLAAGERAARQRRPQHVEVFHHVMTDNQKTAYESEVALPPTEWQYGRVILTLDLHDAGDSWDEWDRNGLLSIWDADGNKHGIVPFITSYRTPCHWKVDVTHFRPWLSGKTRFEIRAGTKFYKNRGYLMSVSLDFYPGAAKEQAFQIVPLWEGAAKYKSSENHFQDFFEPKEIEIPEDVVAARAFVTTTGHSQVGEFTPSKRTLVWTANKDDETSTAQRFENTLWKTDCYLNPNRPQFGTWKYSRAGWAPGDVVRPWWVDLTPHLVGGQTATFKYESAPYAFPAGQAPPADKEINKASHVIRSYLILYRDAKGAMAPPTLRITSVADKSAAAEAGVKAGDFLMSYDGARVESTDDLRAAIQAAATANKSEVALVVYRGTERIDLTIARGRMGISLAGG